MKNTQTLYTLTFHPIQKEKIWGGTKLKKLLNKPFSGNHIGESWEISDVGNDCSVVKNGPLAGSTLRDLMQRYPKEIVGEEVYKKFKHHFPLLIKFIDARENLSVQLHPDDEIAKKRHNSYGKTEMWYIMQADDDSRIIIDFNEQISKDVYLKHLKNESLPTILNAEKVKTGDCYIIHPGLIHAIGKGVLLTEIQQTSDVTYRVYDWNRPDINGEKRELHTALALDAIDFSKTSNYKLAYTKKENDSVRMEQNQYFTTNYLYLTQAKEDSYTTVESFIIYICVEGKCEILCKKTKEKVALNTGQTALIPAQCETVFIETNKCVLLEVTI